MGSQVSTAANQTGTIASYLADFPDYQYEASLESTRFLKTIRAKHEQGTVVVKIFIKQDTTLFYSNYIYQIERIKSVLSGISNAMPFVHVGETERAVIAVRPYLFHNVYDRISTRPFLSSIEKKWLAFQLLMALKQCHHAGVCHGDIRLENILATSWNWLQLADFASFKPTLLPEDNPAAFAFFFDTSGRRVCYVAPERFYNPATTKQEIADVIVSETDEYRECKLRPAMDIFSAGCVIAELLLDGHPLFTFAQLLAYRKNEYDPEPTLTRIEDVHARDLVRHMIQRDPKKRHTAVEYLVDMRDKLFPNNFYSFLHNFCGSHARKLSPDEKIAHIKYHMNEILSALTDEHPEVIKRKYSLGLPSSLKQQSEQRSATSALSAMALANLSSPRPDRHATLRSPVNTPLEAPSKDSSMVVVSAMVTTSIRAVRLPSSKVAGLEMLLVFAAYLTDIMKLDREVPYVVAMLRDSVQLVRACAVRTLARLMEIVTVVPLSEANIFPEYILPSLSHIAGENGDEEVMVRVAYAENMASLAETALRYLESTQVVKMLGQRGGIHTVVKRVLLPDMTRLCIFFGRQKSNDVLLSHMACYLNESDWRLRRALFDGIVGVGLYIGGQSLEQYILPLLEEGLTDTEESVVEKALRALTSLADFSLFQLRTLLRLSSMIGPLLVHPNIWIRLEAVGFVTSVGNVILLADNHVRLLPIISPFLNASLIEIRHATVVLAALKKPLSRAVYDIMLTGPDQANLWHWLEHSHASQHPPLNTANEARDLTPLIDLTREEKEKLLALKTYINRVTTKNRNLTNKGLMMQSGSKMIKLGLMKNINVQSTEIEPINSPPINIDSQEQQGGGSISISSPQLRSQQSSTNNMAYLPRAATELSIGFHTQSHSFCSYGHDDDNTSVGVKDTSACDCRANIKVGAALDFGKLLRKKQRVIFPPIRSDMGVLSTTANNSRRDTSGNQPRSQSRSSWKPEGVLVAHLLEHKGSVNRIAVSPDSAFFATASDDGAVKIWDTQRMIGNFAVRSSQTYAPQGGRIKGLTLCEHSYSLASLSDNNSIYVFRVDIEQSNDKRRVWVGNPIFTKHIDEQEEGAVIDLHHYHTQDGQSLLMYNTLRGNIYAYDLRCNAPALKLKSEPSWGTLNAFTADSTRSALVGGTSRGVMAVWDMRYNVAAMTWALPNRYPITRLTRSDYFPLLHMVVAAGPSVSVWDVENRRCTHLLQPGGDMTSDPQLPLDMPLDV
eukprot:Ihof_evm25s5 gene=Ihof_evmTU25s5